ncbi:S8 family serine peptidase [Paenibacillus sp. WQ 127069]|uniref:S8 family serine peptidase n=1 Tax=Paenibacillus baimaensis TaxID=2982185 RepID=A0ABT2UR61_9BACL|nr:S8 family serine peptidase [Paenibacillus sp. WQ 127069]MCU6797130.1 S8 family serine peptidase [Paenibacillus sp. WQ 127069]
MKKIINVALSALLLLGIWSIPPVHAQSYDTETTPSLAWAADSTTAQSSLRSSSDLNANSMYTAVTDKAAMLPDQVLVKYKKGSPSAHSPSQASPQISTQSMETDASIGAVRLELPTGSNVWQTIKELHSNPDVEYAQPVYVYRLSAPSVSSAVYANDLLSQQWGIKASHLDPLWEMVSEEKRKNIIIAIVDSGVDLNHPDLKDSLERGANFVNPSLPTANANDDNGHGTHVAGIAAAITNNGIGIAGVAGGVRILPIKVTNAKGTGNSRSIGLGIIEAADRGASVINLSLGGDSIDPYLQDAIQYAQKKGAVVVAASGNESNHATGVHAPVAYPAAYPGVISVGAIDEPETDDITNNNTGAYRYAYFTNTGPELKVVASGVNIYSTVPGGANDMKSGTSMATPYVTGLAAMLKAANPKLNADQIQTIIINTATDLGVPGRDDIYGNGLIDGVRAFTTPRLELKYLQPSQPTVATNTYTYMPVTINATDYNGNVNASIHSASAGSVLLKVNQYESNTGQWIPVPSLDREVSLSGGTTFVGLELPLNNQLYSVSAVQQSAASNQLYVPSSPLYSKAMLPSGDSSLKALSLNQGQIALSPAFQAERGYYEISDQENSVTSIQVSAAANSTAAKISINGQALGAAEGSSTVTLKEGYNSITITVTAENLTTQNYTVSIYRKYLPSNNYISSIYYDSGSITPQFSRDTLNYTLYVDNSVTSIGFGALLENKASTMVIDSTPVASGLIVRNTVPFQVGSNSRQVKVTAPNGTIRVYTFNIIRLSGSLGSMLKSVVLDGGIPISPTFNPEQTSYQAAVSSTSTQITVNLEPMVSTATVKLNDTVMAAGNSGVVQLNSGDTSFTATVNAVTGDTKTYTFSLIRPVATNTGIAGGGGGGGGGFGIIPTTGGTTTTTDTSASAVVVVKAPNEQLKKELESSASTQVTIDAKTSNTGTGLQIEFDASILMLATEKNKSIVIDTGRQLFQLPPGAVPATDGSAVVTFSVIPTTGTTALSKKPNQARDISSVYDFSLTLGALPIHVFTKPLSIQWKVDLPQDVQLPKVGVFTFNEAKQSWDYVGGKAAADGSFTFSTNHFSQYVVFENNKTFTDMTTHWAKSEVELLASKTIVTGITNQTFGPEQKLTRAEFAALLVRTLGLQTSQSAGTFQDVKSGDWFNDVVYHAYDAGIIEGLDATTFAPNQLISREQMAVMIIRAYSKGTGKPVSEITTTQEVKFTDDNQTGSWARSSVQLASGVGLLSGFPDGTFKPSDTASRAEAAVVIKRLLDLTGK